MKHKSATPWAREVWKRAFPGEAWPKGWRMEWVGFMRGAAGLTVWSERRVLLSLGDRKRCNPIHTLCHEFVHVRFPRLRHGRDFTRLTDAAITRVWSKAEAERMRPPDGREGE